MSKEQTSHYILVKQGDAPMLLMGCQIIKNELFVPWGRLCCVAYKTDANEFVVAIEFYDLTRDKHAGDYRVFDTMEDAAHFCAHSKEAFEMACDTISDAHMLWD